MDGLVDIDILESVYSNSWRIVTMNAKKIVFIVSCIICVTDSKPNFIIMIMDDVSTHACL